MKFLLYAFMILAVPVLIISIFLLAFLIVEVLPCWTGAKSVVSGCGVAPLALIGFVQLGGVIALLAWGIFAAHRKLKSF